MVRKSTLALIITISILMSYGGCDGDGGGQGQGAPGGGVPEEACDICPCDYFSVPMTTGCWVSDDMGPTFDPGDEGIPGERCSLYPTDLGFGNGIAVFSELAFACPESERCCRITSLNSDTCDRPNETVGHLSIDEVRACQACLEEYATELNESGIAAVSAGPPYTCITK